MVLSASKVELTPSQEYKLAGEFQARPAPHVEKSDLWPKLDKIESHEGEVVFSAPIELAEGVDPNTL